MLNQKRKMKERQILKDAEKADELWYQLYEIGHEDDSKEVSDWTDEEIISEAKYCLSKYAPSEGWIHGEMIAGDLGAEERKMALRERAQIKRFLKKYNVAEVK
jgi:hypothetical protein